jgi:RNA polymerase sigma factor (sigma-70 family)
MADFKPDDGRPRNAGEGAVGGPPQGAGRPAAPPADVEERARLIDRVARLEQVDPAQLADVADRLGPAAGETSLAELSGRLERAVPLLQVACRNRLPVGRLFEVASEAGLDVGQLARTMEQLERRGPALPAEGPGRLLEEAVSVLCTGRLTDDGFREWLMDWWRHDAPRANGRVRRLPVEGDDLHDETWLKAWAARAQFDPLRSTMAQWARGIFHNATTDEARSPWHARKQDRPEALGGMADPADGPPELSAGREDQGRCADALARLGEPDRELLLWKFRDGLSQKEIAERVGRSNSWVSLRLQKVYGRLRKLLGDQR